MAVLASEVQWCEPELHQRYIKGKANPTNPLTACTTVQPLYKDNPEIRTSLYSGHCLGSKLNRVVYKTIPKMRAPH